MFIFSFGADALAYFQYLEKWLISLGISPEKAASVNGFVLHITSIIIIALIIAYIIYHIVMHKLKNAGTRGIPCAILPYYYFKLRNMHHTLLTELHHGVYHQMFLVKQHVAQLKLQNAQNVDLPLTAIEQEIGEVLSTFYKLLHSVFYIDLSISVYLLSENQSRQPILTKVAFFRSQSEGKKEGERTIGVPYLVSRSDDQAIENYVNRAREYNTQHGNGSYLKNSVFDHILSTNQHEWLSNDLKLDDKGNQFFSSSPNVNRFYHAMAAFAILPPTCVGNQHSAIKGILTFDSTKRNVFSQDECFFSMGLMAHVLYDILEELKN